MPRSSKWILDLYYPFFKQAMNLRKPFVSFSSNTREATKEEICEDLGVGREVEIGKYPRTISRMGKD